MKVCWMSTHGEVEEETINKVEKSLGMCKSESRGTPIPGAFYLHEYGEGVINRLLSFNEDSPIYILKMWESLNTMHEQPKELIPFANDPFGNVYCFDYRQKETPSLVTYDHEERDVEPLCCTFSDLMAGIVKEDGDF